MLGNNTNNTDDVELFYNTHISQEYIQELCEETAQGIVNKYFLGDVIDNATYEQNIFKLVKKLIILSLADFSKKDMNFNVLLSIYIFKKHFKLIFGYLSEYLIEEVAYSNHDVINFLKYYSLNAIVVDKEKYIVPQIKEKDGPRWNVTSMLSIVKTHIKTLDQLHEMQNRLDDIQKKIQTYFVEGISPKIHNQNIKEKFEKLEEDIKKNTSEIDTIHDSLNILTNNIEIVRAQKELENAHDQRMDLREIKTELIKAKVKQIKMLEYQGLCAQADSLQKEISPKNRIVQQNQDTYISIKNALIKALISKKQAL